MRCWRAPCWCTGRSRSAACARSRRSSTRRRIFRRGYTYLKTRIPLNPEHPPLVKELAAFPPLDCEPRVRARSVRTSTAPAIESATVLYRWTTGTGCSSGAACRSWPGRRAGVGGLPVDAKPVRNRARRRGPVPERAQSGASGSRPDRHHGPGHLALHVPVRHRVPRRDRACHADTVGLAGLAVGASSPPSSPRSCCCRSWRFFRCGSPC